MRIFRFVFPFLFVRNWQSGVWEFSRARFILIGIALLFLMVGLIIAYILRAPAVYINPV